MKYDPDLMRSIPLDAEEIAAGKPWVATNTMVQTKYRPISDYEKSNHHPE
jgi:hypothetical protein